MDKMKAKNPVNPVNPVRILRGLAASREKEASAGKPAASRENKRSVLGTKYIF